METAPGPRADARLKKIMRLLFLLTMLLAGCMLVPHKIEIQQGNYVDQAMVAKLKHVEGDIVPADTLSQASAETRRP